MAAVLSSSYWGWNPRHWWTKSNPECPLTKIQTCPLIVYFPAELRIWICSYLNERDRKSMKQVCRHFRIDLNYIYGVNATLYGHKFWNQMTPVQITRNMLFGNTAETKRIEENANWIRRMVPFPQNLILGRFSSLTFDTRDFVIVPDFVRSLTVELDQRQPEFVLDRLKEVLAYYKNLKHFSLTCRPFNLFMRDFEAYKEFMIKMADHLFTSLELNPHLSELSIYTVDMPSLPVYADFDTHFAEMNIPPEVAATELWFQNPPKLFTMKIQIEGLPMVQLRRWKMFLDAQDRLIHLKLNFGRLHWNFFRTILRKNASSLKTLDIVFLNVCPSRTYLIPHNHNVDHLIQLEWFDWNVLLPAANKLESLILRTETYLPGLYFRLSRFKNNWPNNTHNFNLLVSMTSLQELVLVGIYLNQLQLRIIFTELQTLKNVKLTAWTRPGESVLQKNSSLFWSCEAFGKEDYTERNQNLCDLLKEALLKPTLKSVHLVDVSIWICSAVHRQKLVQEIAGSVYSITWQEPPFCSKPCEFYLFPLIIKIN